MDCLAQITSEKYSNPIEFLNQLRETTEPIGGGMEYCDDGEYVEYDVAVEAVKKAQKQLIDNAVDFISKRFYIGINNHITSKENYYSLTELIRDFEQTMKGE